MITVEDLQTRIIGLVNKEINNEIIEKVTVQNGMVTFFSVREFIDDFNKMWYGNVRHICKKFLCRTQVL